MNLAVAGREAKRWYCPALTRNARSRSADAERQILLAPRERAEVIRYWSALLKYQEALGTRPRARRVAREAGLAANLAQPAPGQDYFKLPLNGAEAFLVERGRLAPLELDAERTQFFEDWLAAQYRRGDEEVDPLSQLALFPVLHLARDELAGLLRFPVELNWQTGNATFTPPSAEDRAQSRFPDAPTTLRLDHVGRDPDETLPFFVDTGLLRRTLKLEPDEIEAFFTRLRQIERLDGKRMVAELCALLETELEGERRESPPEQQLGGAAELLQRLELAVKTRLARLRVNARAYPVALIVSSQKSRATFHVQRDLEAAHTLLKDELLPEQSPLVAYLAGQQRAEPEVTSLGRWPAAPLSASQKQALEYALGQHLAAIQGPPGTGKTTLILNAVAHQLVEQCVTLAADRLPDGDVLLVTSTNNRAVDNVIDPLTRELHAELPIGLRLGNRDVTASVTLRTLERVQAWLGAQLSATNVEWEQAKQRFAERYRRVEQTLAPRELARTRQLELQQLHSKRSELGASTETSTSVLAAVQRALGALTSIEPALSGAHWQSEPRAASDEIATAIRSLGELSKACEPGHAPIGEIERQAARFERRHRRKLTRALGIELSLALPDPSAKPKPDAEAWEAAIEALIAKLTELADSLNTFAERVEREAELLDLDARIDALANDAAQTAEPAATGIPESELEAELVALFHDALALRAVWLRRNSREVGDCLRLAIASCKRSRSLRSLLEASRGAGLWLRRLFPCFGCTLLSLGNACAPEPEAFARVIIDEAGQCHSAYAVSALLRARSALLIGDVHQLEPVIDLGLDDERRLRKGLKLKLEDAKLEPYRVFAESGHSAQSLADRAVAERPTLREHFRCQAEIIALSEAWCDYGLVALTPRASLSAQVSTLAAPVLFQPIDGEQARFAGSWYNQRELVQVTAWLRHLLAHAVPPEDIAVITPYRGQCEALFRAFRSEGIPVERGFDEGEGESLFERPGAIALGTVHRFQGGERRVVLFTTTVTRRANLGFLNDRVHLLNVAASRAKQHLVIIGHEATLAAGNNTRLLTTGHPRVAAQ